MQNCIKNIGGKNGKSILLQFFKYFNFLSYYNVITAVRNKVFMSVWCKENNVLIFKVIKQKNAMKKKTVSQNLPHGV